jgi:hypothetical protein
MKTVPLLLTGNVRTIHDVGGDGGNGRIGGPLFRLLGVGGQVVCPWWASGFPWGQVLFKIHLPHGQVDF